MTQKIDTSEGAATRRGVLVGVDGSEASKAALAWAAHWAKLAGEPLVAVTVWTYPASFGWAVPLPDDYDPAAAARSTLDSTLDEVLGPAPGIELTRLVLSGHPAPVLVEQSAAVSLVVVGCRGHGEFAGMLLGSVSEFLVTHARCPVLVVRDLERPQTTTRG